MAVNTEYYRNHFVTDPTYTMSDAIVQYFLYEGDRSSEAMELANQIWDADDGYCDRLLTYSDCKDIISEMDPLDAFQTGATSEALMRGHYYTYDGDCCFKLVPDHQAYVRDVIRHATEDIVRGKYRISKDLRSVIDAVESAKAGSRNVKSRTSATRPAKAKPKASNNLRVKSASGKTKKAPAKKPGTARRR